MCDKNSIICFKMNDLLTLYQLKTFRRVLYLAKPRGIHKILFKIKIESFLY